MSGINALQKLDTARRMLEEAKTAPEIKQVKDLAEQARLYAKRKGLGLEAQNYAAEIHLDSMRKLGRILEKLNRRQGARSDLTSSSNGKSSEYKSVLDEIETSYREAQRCELVASLPEVRYIEHKKEVKANQKELTAASVLREVQAYIRECHHSDLESIEIPNGKYRVFYADPPWQYNDSGVITDSDNYGHAERHYPTMSIDELCLLPVKEMAEDDAVLFLWVTSPLLEDSFKVIKAWGFQYKTSFVWDKIRHNFGHYNSVRHEFLLVCTRGSCTPDTLKLFDSVQAIEKTSEHSQKPAEFRAIIDTLYTHGNKIELFAREAVEGWQGWGNEYAAA